MTIVHSVISLDVGGLERIVLGLILEGRRAGYEVAVICMERPGALADAATAAGATVYSLDKAKKRRADFVRRGRELLARLAPDVVHTHQIAATWGLGRSAAALGIPVIHTEHGNHFSESDGWISSLKRQLLYRMALKRVKRICCVSGEIAEGLKRWRIAPRTKITVVTNGIDQEPFVDLPPVEQARKEFGIDLDAFVLGTVGRLAEVKRQDFLLRGAAKLRSQIPNLWVLVVGDGPERKRLELLAKDLDLGDRCVFAGFQSRPEIGLRAMNVFALTSRSEGLPVSMLEAWACGIPVVAGAVGGIPDAVTHETTGLLFKADGLIEFCNAVERLHGAPEFSAAIIRAATQEVSQKYSHQQMMRTYEREYEAMNTSNGGVPACAS